MNSLYYNRVLYNQLDSQVLIFKLFVFIMCPFAAFLFSLKDAASRSSYVIYFLFGIVFCWHMNPTGVERYDDLIGIMQRVLDSNYTWDDICDQIVAFFSFSDDSPKELYENILIFISKSFSRNPHLFFAIASVPFLIFQLKSLRQITSDRKYDGSIYCLIILALFVFPRDIITVQNPRFATALWIAVYATIRFFQSERLDYKYYFLILITPLIHSGFWFYILIFTIGIYLKNFPKLSLTLLYISIPFSYLSYELLSQLNYSLLPSSIGIWMERYMDEESFEKFVMHEGGTGFFWVQQSMTIIRNTIYLLIPIYLWKYRNEYFQKEKRIGKLVQFYLYYYAVVNFIQFIPVLGERFYWIVQILSIYLWFKVIYPRHKNILLLILFGCSYFMLRRYFYGGALSSSVPLDIFYMPLPYLIIDFWNVTTI